MKSLFKAIRVAWLGLWAAIATIILGIPVMRCGPVKPYRQSRVLHFEDLGIHHACRVLCPHGNKKQGEDSEGDIVYHYFQPPVALRHPRAGYHAGHSIPMVHQKGSSQNPDFRVRVVRLTEHLHRPLQYRQGNREH